MQAFSQGSQDGREVGERPYLGGQLVDPFDGNKQRFFILRRQLIPSTGLDEHPEKEVQKVQVLMRRRQAKMD